MNFSIIPEPQRFSVLSDGSVFEFDEFVNFKYSAECENAVSDLTAFLKKVFDMTVVGTGGQLIAFSRDDSINNPEGYRLKVSYSRIEIGYCDGAGAFYAVQTLKQLLLQGELLLPRLEIEDKPRFAYRGFMLDVSSYFFSVEAVKLFLDAMALHKLNRFHWHLTDDQGWRVELYNKLLLAQIGAFRAYTNLGRIPHGGFYSKQDVEEIIAYAHERYITVIPEIESPGHAVAAIAAYPSLSCFDRELTVSTHWSVSHDALCVGKESTFDFMFSVFDEVCEMFPDKIIHIGADNVPTTQWEKCPQCQERIKELGLENEKGLHSYYVGRIVKYLQKKGFEVIMWSDGAPSETIPNGVIAQKRSGGSDTAGGNVICSEAAFRLDLPYGACNLQQCYSFEPQPGENSGGLRGIEACLWTRRADTTEKAGQLAFPRLGAFAETAWTEKERRDYSDFEKKLPAYYGLLDTLPVNYANPKQMKVSPLKKMRESLWNKLS